MLSSTAKPAAAYDAVVLTALNDDPNSVDLYGEKFYDIVNIEKQTKQSATSGTAITMEASPHKIKYADGSSDMLTINQKNRIVNNRERGITYESAGTGEATPDWQNKLAGIQFDENGNMTGRASLFGNEGINECRFNLDSETDQAYNEEKSMEGEEYETQNITDTVETTADSIAAEERNRDGGRNNKVPQRVRGAEYSGENSKAGRNGRRTDANTAEAQSRSIRPLQQNNPRARAHIINAVEEYINSENKSDLGSVLMGKTSVEKAEFFFDSYRENPEFMKNYPQIFGNVESLFSKFDRILSNSETAETVNDDNYFAALDRNDKKTMRAILDKAAAESKG